MREASNRIYQRILASLPAEVTLRYGRVMTDTPSPALEEELQKALSAKDWSAVAQLSVRLAEGGR